MASLIQWLSHPGSRKADGSVNASGKVWFYTPGSSGTQETVYSDADGTAAITQPLTLDAAGRGVVYTKTAVKIRVEDSTGAEIRTSDRGNTDVAAQVEVENAGYTGTSLTTGSQTAGGRTNLNTILTNLYASLGGTDGRYLHASGATNRNLKDWLGQLRVSVKDYGAVGDNVADDTSAIQAAINAVAALTYGGVVYFPPGVYRVSSVLTLSAETNVSFEGAGQGATTIRNTHASNNTLTLTNCANFFIRDLQIDHSDTTNGSTGQAIRLNGCRDVLLSHVWAVDHRIGFDITDDSSGSSPTARTCLFECGAFSISNAASFGLRYGTGAGTTSCDNHVVLGGFYQSGAAGTGIQAGSGTSTLGQIKILGATIGAATTGFDLNASTIVGRGFVLGGCIFSGAYATMINAPGALRFSEFGSVLTGTATTYISGGTGQYDSVASGMLFRRPYGSIGTATDQTLTATGAATVDMLTGNDFLVISNMSAGAQDITIGAPSPVPAAGARGQRLFVRIRITTASTAPNSVIWNATYKVVASDVNLNAGNTTIMEFEWDGANWRQCGAKTTVN